ncbi:hypothetical protein DFH06DRAFT_1123396 [Mycena polygramma]|nr:hypothetical protein DFH06DRAFT_1123396 [Mycena polygramma]
MTTQEIGASFAEIMGWKGIEIDELLPVDLGRIPKIDPCLGIWTVSHIVYRTRSRQERYNGLAISVGETTLVVSKPRVAFMWTENRFHLKCPGITTGPRRIRKDPGKKGAFVSLTTNYTDINLLIRFGPTMLEVAVRFEGPIRKNNRLILGYLNSATLHFRCEKHFSTSMLPFNEGQDLRAMRSTLVNVAVSHVVALQYAFPDLFAVVERIRMDDDTGDHPTIRQGCLAAPPSAFKTCANCSALYIPDNEWDLTSIAQFGIEEPDMRYDDQARQWVELGIRSAIRD